MVSTKLKKSLVKFDRVILWGYRKNKHSHGYIHQAYFELLERLGISVYWVDDIEEANQIVTVGSLVMIPDVHLVGNTKKLINHKFRDDVYYILHPGTYLAIDQLAQTDPSKVVRLYEYRKPYIENLSKDIIFEQVRPFVFSSGLNRTLIQPWGTDLWPDEFLRPVIPSGHDFFFVGTVWGDPEGIINGNRRKLAELCDALSEYGIQFHQISGVSSKENIELVRKSRISASIGAVGHARYSYLQCRTFKNISYGQPTITDVPAFGDILEDDFIKFESWRDGLNKILELSPKQYTDLARAQQEKIRRYSYLDMWQNMVDLF